MNRSWLLAGLVVSVLLIAAGVWFFTQQGDEQTTALVERGSIDVTIQTVGILQATGAMTLRAAQSGSIEILGVNAGDDVAEGDIVILLDMEPFERAVRNAERDLEQAEFALQAAEVQAADDASNAELRLEVLAAAGRVERAEAAVSDAMNARRNAVITSPRAGTVIEMLVRAGDVISANQPVARIATPDDLTVVADVDELDLPNVAPGAEARFRLDAFPASELIGQVVSTAPQARQQGGATVFATEIEFDPTGDLDLRPGMNADVTIVTAARDDVLLIPEAALRTVGDRSFVVVVTGDGTEEREVELGYRGSGRVEIVAGLVEGERVVIR
ncbi:MAG TPA: efflux RND transporter periplasmic adaptor subunit [Thermomicrobiales bacterium]|nr:efflux RND transporter periplasmic adaptor subunit [Thermomicrobiales bacterium]